MNEHTSVWWKRRIGPISRIFSPGYGQCGRCRTTWSFVDGHVTDYSKSGGCFPLCKQCWAELTPAERLPFYRRLWESWSEPNVDWPTLKTAVLTETQRRDTHRCR